MTMFSFFYYCIFFPENIFIIKTIQVFLAQGRVQNLEIRKYTIKKLTKLRGIKWSNFKKHWGINTEVKMYVTYGSYLACLLEQRFLHREQLFMPQKGILSVFFLFLYHNCNSSCNTSWRTKKLSLSFMVKIRSIKGQTFLENPFDRTKSA